MKCFAAMLILILLDTLKHTVGTLAGSCQYSSAARAFPQVCLVRHALKFLCGSASCVFDHLPEQRGAVAEQEVRNVELFDAAAV